MRARACAHSSRSLHFSHFLQHLIFMYPIGSLLPIPLSFHLSCASLFPPTPLSLKNLISTLLPSPPPPYCMPHAPFSSSGLSTAVSNILSKVQPESANVIGSTIYFLLPTLLTVDMHWSLSRTRVSWYKHGYMT